MNFALLQSRVFTIWLGMYGMLLLKRAVGMVVWVARAYLLAQLALLCCADYAAP